jgi:hypothetical protein
MTSAYTPSDWTSFFVAETGAAAALAGLVIVAISINLKMVVENRAMSSRAAETVSLLVSVLVFSTFAIVPGQPLWVLGGEILATGLVVWIGTTIISMRATRHPKEPPLLREAITHGASIPIVLAGVSLLARTGGGLYWLVPAVVVAMVGGVINTWVLLVEVLR